MRKKFLNTHCGYRKETTENGPLILIRRDDLLLDFQSCILGLCLFVCKKKDLFTPRSFNVYGLWAAWPLLKSRIPGKIDMVPVRSK